MKRRLVLGELRRAGPLSRTRIAQRTKLSPAAITGVGLDIAGPIDSERGVRVESCRTGWQGVPLDALLRSRLTVPVWIDNDVNAFATAERLVGRARQATNLAVVTLGRGVGAALVLGGQLYRGLRGAAGEFGHL